MKKIAKLHLMSLQDLCSFALGFTTRATTTRGPSTTTWPSWSWTGLWFSTLPSCQPACPQEPTPRSLTSSSVAGARSEVMKFSYAGVSCKLSSDYVFCNNLISQDRHRVRIPLDASSEVVCWSLLFTLDFETLW